VMSAERRMRPGHAEIVEREKAGIAKASLVPGVILAGSNSQYRCIFVPMHRFTPVKLEWEDFARPIVQSLKLQIRMNLKKKMVEIRSCQFTIDVGAIARAEEYAKAFITGFPLADASALLRLDGLYLESFLVTDIKPLKGEHLSRAIGRIAGTKGKTRQNIEKSTRTRVIVADKRIHVLGAIDNIDQAKTVISDLVLGRPTAKANRKLAAISGRLRREL